MNGTSTSCCARAPCASPPSAPRKALVRAGGCLGVRRPTLLLVLAALLSGCSGDAVSYRLSGAFTAERTQADLDDFSATVAPYSDDVAIMESFPEQFSIRGLDESCEPLREVLLAKPYIASVGECTGYTVDP